MEHLSSGIVLILILSINTLITVDDEFIILTRRIKQRKSHVSYTVYQPNTIRSMTRVISMYKQRSVV